VLGVDVAVEEADCDGGHAIAQQRANDRLQITQVQRAHDSPFGVDTLRKFEAPPAGHERFEDAL
jgi:hypothetical protein